MLLLSISYEGYIGIIATLMGLCAVFITVAPIVYDKRYKELKHELEKQKKKVENLETKLAPYIQETERSQKILKEARDKSAQIGNKQ